MPTAEPQSNSGDFDLQCQRHVAPEPVTLFAPLLLPPYSTNLDGLTRCDEFLILMVNGLEDDIWEKVFVFLINYFFRFVAMENLFDRDKFW